MNIIEAIKYLVNDKNIRMDHWKEGQYLTSNGDLIVNENGEEHRFWIIDYLEESWEVIEPELHTFEEALKAYKSGRNITRKHGGIINNQEYCNFGIDDVMANDWIIFDKKEE